MERPLFSRKSVPPSQDMGNLIRFDPEDRPAPRDDVHQALQPYDVPAPWITELSRVAGCQDLQVVESVKFDVFYHQNLRERFTFVMDNEWPHGL